MKLNQAPQVAVIQNIAPQKLDFGALDSVIEDAEPDSYKNGFMSATHKSQYKSIAGTSFPSSPVRQ